MINHSTTSMKFLPLVCAASLLLTAYGHANVIFTSFGASDANFDVSATSVTQPFACQFIPTQSGRLEEIRLAMIAQDESATSVRVEVLTDLNGLPGEELLDSWHPTIPSGKNTIALQSQSHPVLLAGEKYWLRLSTEAEYLGWFLSIDSHGQIAAWNTVTGNWNPPFDGRLSAFDVSIAPAVSEPSGLIMQVIGVLFLLIWIRSRKLSVCRLQS